MAHPATLSAAGPASASEPDWSVRIQDKIGDGGGVAVSVLTFAFTCSPLRHYRAEDWLLCCLWLQLVAPVQQRRSTVAQLCHLSVQYPASTQGTEPSSALGQVVEQSPLWIPQLFLWGTVFALDICGSRDYAL